MKDTPNDNKISLSIVTEILDDVLDKLTNLCSHKIVQTTHESPAVSTPGRIRISPTSKMFKSVSSLLDQDTKSKRIVIPPKRFLDEGDSISIPSGKEKGRLESDTVMKGNPKKMEKVYCICRKAYTKSDHSMIGCDGPCGEWFHFNCIGIPDHFISRAAWYCKKCFTEMTGTGEACVCGGGWRADQELLRCQGECRIWYHPQCKKVDTEYCSKLGTWKKFSKTWKCDMCLEQDTALRK